MITHDYDDLSLHLPTYIILYMYVYLMPGMNMLLTIHY